MEKQNQDPRKAFWSYYSRHFLNIPKKQKLRQGVEGEVPALSGAEKVKVYPEMADKLVQDFPSTEEGRFLDDAFGAALYMLNNSFHNHANLTPLAEALSFYREKGLLTEQQENQFSTHYQNCKQCIDEVNGLENLIPLYELEAGKKLTKFPVKPKQKNRLYQKGARSILEFFDHQDYSDSNLEAAMYILEKTIHRHNKEVSHLANEMARLTLGNELPDNYTARYLPHSEACIQCRETTDIASSVKKAFSKQ